MHQSPAMRLFAVSALAFALVGFAPQGTRKGSPEENLPANITRLTHFGERASWSPDDKRIAFMEKSFGDVFEVDVATKNIRLLTHYPHAGFLRVQFLPNGDYFLIGAPHVHGHPDDAVERSGDVDPARRMSSRAIVRCAGSQDFRRRGHLEASR